MQDVINRTQGCERLIDEKITKDFELNKKKAFIEIFYFYRFFVDINFIFIDW